MPLLDEIKSMREGVGVYEAAHDGQILITGTDAASFLHRMLSNEVKNLKVGEGRYQGLLDRKGMVLSLFYLLRLENEKFLAVLPPQLTVKTCDILNKMKFIQKVVLQDISQERKLIQVIGPKAEEVLKNKIPDGAIVWKEDFFGVPVWNVSAPGRTHGSPLQECTQLSPNAIRLLKMEAGFPEYGVDINDTHILLEAGLPYTYQRNKGCYPGQEVIERILTYGKGRTPKSLCVLKMNGDVAGTISEIFTTSGEKAGVVTSAIYNPLEQKTIVMAYIDHQFIGATLHPPGQGVRPIV